MKTRNRLKKHLFLMLMLSIVFFISAYLISDGLKKYYSPSIVTKRLNFEVARAFTGLVSEIEKVGAEKFKDNRIFSGFLNKEYKNAFAGEGLEILVYEKDSLKFWTDNTFEAPVFLTSLTSDSEIVQSGNGYYLVKQKRFHDYTVVALQLVRYNYKYLNDYLPNRFHQKFSCPDNVTIDLNPGVYQVKSEKGKFLFSLNYTQPFELALWLQYLIFILYVSSFLLLVTSTYYLYRLLMLEFGHKKLLIAAFITDALILRIVQFYLQWPGNFYELQFFNPSFFASSELLPSLGDFLINAILGIQLAYYIFKSRVFPSKSKHLGNILKKVFILACFLIIILFFHFLTSTISSLVLDSSISFRFENILSLPHISHFGIFILATLLFGFLLIFEMLGQQIINISEGVNGRKALIYSLSGLTVYIAISSLFGQFDLFISVLFLILLLIISFRSNRIKPRKIYFSRTVYVLILLTAMATYILNKAELYREHEKRKLMAVHLADSRDNLAEYYFNEAARNMQKDKKLAEMLVADSNVVLPSTVPDYIKEKYFADYWNKYIIQVTVCQPGKQLTIMPENIITGCETYFDGKINQFMQPVSVPGLYFLRHSVDDMYYLGKIKITGTGSKSKYSNIFVEINSNDTWKGLGYPELLIDRKNTNFDNLNTYSYAFYKKGELVKNFGKHSYNIDNQTDKVWGEKTSFHNSNGYSHYTYMADQDTMIVISKEVPGISDLISPFSYIFLLLMLIFFVVSWLYGYSFTWREGLHTFRFRLQLIMIAVIIASSLLLVTVSLLFINTLNRNKNNEILSEKLNSVLIDLENRYGNITSLDLIPKGELTNLLINQSNTYFTDVNLYSTKGFLLASSRDQIFEEGMISDQMNPSCARQLMIDKKSLIIERENIGSYTFLSAYTPLRNMDNRLLGYLNLPYFAKQEEIRREISGLISAFANIYIIMIVITVLVALILSRYITMPLQQIGKQFSMVKIGGANPRIEWRRKDEIGRLVDEYNRMIDEMARSAELLARSERESAWRQMARQVAHEIKNPLTPIKLSMQLLMRAWNDKAPDWEIRLKRFSQTLIMQIDTLSSIATEFSDFAQMPESQIQEFDVVPLIQQSALLFRDQSDSEITVNTQFQECFIKSDQNQILRVFNNLIKNALQAIPTDRKGEIIISLTKDDSFCVISFKDNGTGIPTEQQTRIFSPNFTTKTAGMGLGLAMVKNIIDNSSGRIWFETVPGEGTIFFVSLPLL